MYYTIESSDPLRDISRAYNSDEADNCTTATQFGGTINYTYTNAGRPWKFPQK